MVLEVAILQIKEGMSRIFEDSFRKASTLISCQKGYISHEIKKCIEVDDKYILLVQWETIEDHEIGFRKSEKYQLWKALLHDFYEPFPTVEHYRTI